MVAGALTHYALLHSVSDLKATQINVYYSLILELMLNKFELGYNTTEATKKICVKGEGAIDFSRATRWFKKICSGCKNLNQERSGRPKTGF